MAVITLSNEANAVILCAHEYAEQKKYLNIDSPHLFWSLLTFSNAGREWIECCGGHSDFIEKLTVAIERWYETGNGDAKPTAGYILVMRAAQDHASLSGAFEITPGHLLKAILETDSFLREWLKDQGVGSAPVSIVAPTPLLDELGRDLTRLARKGELSPIIGREDEVRQLTEILLRHGKNSALLLGLSGVGKTAVVERLAQDIAEGKVPPKLAGIRLIELNVGTLISGTSYRGELEGRIKILLEEIRRTDDVIIVIDEFHMLVGAGSASGSGGDIANILKPALARGDLTCIGITTFEEFTRHIEGDAAFARRFEKVVVSEPSESDSRAILAGVVSRYEKHHNLIVQPDALDMIISLAVQYLPTRQFPDKAVDILGIACSRAELQRSPVVTPDLVTTIVGDIAGVPVGQLTVNVQALLTSLETNLSKHVIGQNAAVTVLVKAIQLAYTGLRDPRRPKGVFLFAGPSGVGKTELAKSLTEHLFGDTKALLRLDMSEYAEKHTVSRLIGAPPGYLGYDEPGQLSQRLRDRPYSVVLLDEIEKAHPDVFDLFLSLFDEGRLTDSHGRPVDGRHALFVMTSNLGTTHSQRSGILGFDRRPEPRNDSLEEALQSFFRPEFLNRIDHIIRFRELDTDDLAEIAALELQALKVRLKAQGVRLTYADMVLDLLATESLQKGAGARGIKRVVEVLVAVPISTLLVSQTAGKHQWLHIEVERGVIVPRWV